jgi:hypothetical protein
MNRRGFFAALAGVAAAAVVPFKAPEPPALRLHPDAFRLVSESLAAGRVDVLYGYGTFCPEMAVKVWEA